MAVPFHYYTHWSHLIKISEQTLVLRDLINLMTVMMSVLIKRPADEAKVSRSAPASSRYVR